MIRVSARQSRDWAPQGFAPRPLGATRARIGSSAIHGRRSVFGSAIHGGGRPLGPPRCAGGLSWPAVGSRGRGGAGVAGWPGPLRRADPPSPRSRNGDGPSQV